MKYLVASIALVRSACAAPQVNFAMNDVPKAARPFPLELKMVTVEPKHKSTLTPEMQTIVALNWKTALEQAVTAGGYFADKADKQVDLISTISELKTDEKMENGTAIARYEIVDSKTRKALYTAEVSSSASDSTFVDKQRGPKLLNNLAKANLEKFLEGLRSNTAQELFGGK